MRKRKSERAHRRARSLASLKTHGRLSRSEIDAREANEAFESRSRVIYTAMGNRAGNTYMCTCTYRAEGIYEERTQRVDSCGKKSRAACLMSRSRGAINQRARGSLSSRHVSRNI